MLQSFLFTILVFYGCGLAMGATKKKVWQKLWLIVSIVISVGLLAVFKYADFFVDSFNAATGLSVPLLRLALPIGISFYTFQCLSYTIDVYRGNVPSQKNPISFGAYVALFPQLIMKIYTDEPGVISEGIVYLRYSVASYVFQGLALTCTIVLRNVNFSKYNEFMPDFIPYHAHMKNCASR